MNIYRPAVLVVGLLALASLRVSASQTITEQEGLDCTVCHVKKGKDLLTDKGQYYELMRSLEGYELVLEKFGRCEFCHLNQPGATELTKDGYRFRWMMENMAGLEAWLLENHPKAPSEDESETDSSDEQPEGR
jgi:hypothetical protein